MRGQPVLAEIAQRDPLNAVLRKNLAYFIQRVFASVDPGAIYLDNWHNYAIACQIERIESGEINSLIITMPPRYLKSISCSIAYSAGVLATIQAGRLLPFPIRKSWRKNLPTTVARLCSRTGTKTALQKRECRG